MTQEQVIKGLECCCDVQSEWKDALYVCPACPYKHNGIPCETLAPLLDDALTLLKPRLLTDADFINNPNVDSDGRLPAWIEYRRDNEEWAEYWEDTNDEWAIVQETNFKAEGYRSWNKRPTKEQMEATEWEKEEDE